MARAAEEGEAEAEAEAEDRAGEVTRKGRRGGGGGGHGLGKNFIAGAVAGGTSTVLFQPFDVVKTHMQASESSAPPRIRDVVRCIASQKGIRGLWAGTSPAFLRVSIGAGLYFSMLGPFLSLLSTGAFSSPSSSSSSSSSSSEHLRRTLPSSVILAAGALTRSVSALIVCPITVIKTRMEYEAASGVRYSNILSALTIIRRTEGLKSLYSGLLPTILRDAPYSGLYLLLYSTTQRKLTDWQGQETSSRLHLNFLAGAVAGATATVLTHPPDVVRTRMQLDNSGQMNMFSAARSIFKVHGVSGFFAGVLPRAGRRAVHQAFSWTIYEELVRMTS